MPCSALLASTVSLPQPETASMPSATTAVPTTADQRFEAMPRCGAARRDGPCAEPPGHPVRVRRRVALAFFLGHRADDQAPVFDLPLDVLEPQVATLLGALTLRLHRGVVPSARLEAGLEALQDSTYRQDVMHDAKIADLRHNQHRG